VTRTKKILATIALMLGIITTAASPALADSHSPVAPPDSHSPVAPLDSHIP
jgi:hypothetical protein